MGRFLGLTLTTLALFLLLLPALSLRELGEPRRVVMTQFYLSIALLLVLTYLLQAAGRAANLALTPGREDGSLAARLQFLGFPILHRHAWGDFGRLVALAFLTFVGPTLVSLFVTLVASGFIGFEGTVALGAEGGGLSETAAIRAAASGEIPLSPADQAREARVTLVRNSGLVAGFLLFMPCLARLVPYFFWRAGGHEAASLAQTWRAVPWRLALPFGVGLFLGLGAAVSLPLPLPLVYAMLALFLGLWSLTYALCLRDLDPDMGGEGGGE